MAQRTVSRRVAAVLVSMVGLTFAACAPRGEGLRAGSTAPGAKTGAGGADSATSSSTGGSQVGGEAPIDFGVLGRVLDASGKPVSGASVGAQVLDASSGPIPEIGVMTDENGEFHWPLRPGRYRLTPYLEGARIEPQDVQVEPGKATRITFTLRSK